MSTNQITDHFLEAQKILSEFVNNPQNFEKIKQAGDQMISSIQAGGKVISCGNGGSMSDAMHFAEEMTGRFREMFAGYGNCETSNNSIPGGHAIKNSMYLRKVAVHQTKKRSFHHPMDFRPPHSLMI